jgi:hypothetical protein
MMKIIFPINSSPATFGIAQDGDTLYVISPCCKALVLYDRGDGRPLPAPPTFSEVLGGPPKGVTKVFCGKCEAWYRGYSNPSKTLNQDDLTNSSGNYLGKHWVGPWLGLEDVEVTVDG